MKRYFEIISIYYHADKTDDFAWHIKSRKMKDIFHRNLTVRYAERKAAALHKRFPNDFSCEVTKLNNGTICHTWCGYIEMR